LRDRHLGFGSFAGYVKVTLNMAMIELSTKASQTTPKREFARHVSDKPSDYSTILVLWHP